MKHLLTYILVASLVFVINACGMNAETGVRDFSEDELELSQGG